VRIFAAVWMLVAMVVAVRQALDFKSTARAVGVCVLGWIVVVVVNLLLFGISRRLATTRLIPACVGLSPAGASATPIY
jgi:hypothetical protein